MNPKLVTAAVGQVLQLASVKDCLRVDGTALDSQIEDAIASAEADFERKTGRVLLASTWDYTIERFPCGDFIRLPKGEIISVTSIKYYDTAGVEATFSSADYELDIPGAAIVLKYGKSWPSTILRTANQIIIRYVAGWATEAAVPADIKRALRIHIDSQIFGSREAGIGQTQAELNRIDAIWQNACTEWAAL